MQRDNTDEDSSFPLISLKSVGRVHKTQAGSVGVLIDVTLSVKQGEFVCISGPSGAGKSTLLSILGCLDTQFEGEYRLASRDVRCIEADELASLRSDLCGFIFQDYALLERYSAQANVELAATYAGMNQPKRSECAMQLLDRLGLAERRGHRSTELSGGEQQRVSIARALVKNPRLILADEPTGSLDAERGEEIMSLLEGLVSEGLTVIVVSHDAKVAGRAHRQIELRDGRVVRDSLQAEGEMAENPESQRPPKRESQSTSNRSAPKLHDVLAFGLQSLRTTPRRSLLCVGAAMVGLSCALALFAVSNGTYQASLMVMGTLGVDRFFAREPFEDEIPPGSSAVQLEPLIPEFQQLENVRGIFPQIYIEAGPLRHGTQEIASVEVLASEQAPEFMWTHYPVASGELLNSIDARRRARVAVIDHLTASLLFEDFSDAPGNTIHLAGEPFLVKGVLAPHPILQAETYRGRREFPRIFIPFSTARDLTFGNNRPVSVAFLVVDPTRIYDTMREVTDLVVRRQGLVEFDVGRTAYEGIVQPFHNATRLRVTVLSSVGAAVLLTSALAVMSVMLMAVRQRRREIGLRLALGARRRDITTQIFTESGVVSILGVALGLPLGLALAPILEAWFELPSVHTYWSVLSLTAACLFAGLLSSIIPARSASETNPMILLKMG